MKTCLIKQSAGIGDILYCQKIAKTAVIKGYEVVWPVVEPFKYVKEYLESPGITYCLESDDFPHKDKFGGTEIIDDGDLLYIPLQTAGRKNLDSSVMLAKYKMIGMDWTDWAKYVDIKRNREKEQTLYEKHNLKDDSEYVFINRNFASPPHQQTVKGIPTFEGIRQVEMNIDPGFTLFDWYKILENAKEIHTAETALNYLIELGNIKGKLNMYSKWDPPNFKHIDMLFEKDWNYVN